MFLTEEQIKDYQTDGVIIVKEIFKDWIEPLRKGFKKVLDNPSKHGRENVGKNQGRFFEDYWRFSKPDTGVLMKNLSISHDSSFRNKKCGSK